jgi:hypothetical protein
VSAKEKRLLSACIVPPAGAAVAAALRARVRPFCTAAAGWERALLCTAGQPLTKRSTVTVSVAMRVAAALGAVLAACAQVDARRLSQALLSVAAAAAATTAPASSAASAAATFSVAAAATLARAAQSSSATAAGAAAAALTTTVAAAAEPAAVPVCTAGAAAACAAAGSARAPVAAAAAAAGWRARAGV